MLQQEEPADYVIATGVSRRVGELVEIAFAHAGLDWRHHVRVDDSLLRGRAELHRLVGDNTQARERLGWEPSVSFEELVRMLVDADLAARPAQAAGLGADSA
jgi:GDPmannose 4,6-dehydratase